MKLIMGELSCSGYFAFDYVFWHVSLGLKLGMRGLLAYRENDGIVTCRSVAC